MHTIRLIVFLGLISTLLLGCTSMQPQTTNSFVEQKPSAPRIIAIGDSLMSWNGLLRQSIPDLISRTLGEPVYNQTMPGARFGKAQGNGISIGNIAIKQANQQAWEIAVMNGGGNDLWMGCGCGQCQKQLDQLITPDATQGAVVRMAQHVINNGTDIIYLGYLRTPGVNSPIEACANVGDQFEQRLMKLERQLDGFSFISLKQVVPHGSLAYHSFDRIHPSTLGSAEIAKLAVQEITRLRTNQ